MVTGTRKRNYISVHDTLLALCEQNSPGTIIWSFDVSLLLSWISCWPIELLVISDAMTVIWSHCNDNCIWKLWCLMLLILRGSNPTGIRYVSFNKSIKFLFYNWKYILVIYIMIVLPTGLGRSDKETSKMETAHYFKSPFDAKYKNLSIWCIIWYIFTFGMNMMKSWQGSGLPLLDLCEGKIHW